MFNKHALLVVSVMTTQSFSLFGCGGREASAAGSLASSRSMKAAAARLRPGIFDQGVKTNG
jgi:hypothetical protein